MSAEAVVQAQLDAYNVKDLEALLATYAPDACQYEVPAKLLAQGHEALRARMVARFADPVLHAELLSRRVLGAHVIDHERVTRSGPEGPLQVELLAIYEVREGLIRNVSFVFG